jgi:UDP-N-acetylmuramoyl-tripeptide--D-alanyl-D-alanine ligase
MHVDLNFIKSVIPQAYLEGNCWLHDANFNIDSRTIVPGEIFVALSGSKFDGHDFIDQALDRGAVGFVLEISKKDKVLAKYSKQFKNKSVLFVDDSLHALIELARAWRSKFDIPMVGVTGSVGKTTTKEIVRNILKVAHMDALVSSGNQNTMIGASMNILKLREHHKAAVFEMGISEIGNMKNLTELIRPTYAIVTQIGHAHMQGLGGLELISKEKREIFSLFTEKDIGIINGDQKELKEVSYKHPVICFGKKRTNQIQARKIICDKNSISFTLLIYKNKYSVVLPTCSQARIMNALAAVSIGYLLKIPHELLIKGIELPVIVPGRFETLQLSSGAEIINDAYNANPESVKASLASFDAYETDKNKIVVLGDMLELGSDSVYWHRQIGRFLSKIKNLQEIVLIGVQVAHMKKSLPYGVKVQIFENSDQAYDVLKLLSQNSKNSMLFKASNSIGFTQLIEKLLK